MQQPGNLLQTSLHICYCPCPAACWMSGTSGSHRHTCCTFLLGYVAKGDLAYAGLKTGMYNVGHEFTAMQDAVVKGWFRSTRSPSHGETDYRTVAVTAFEIVSAMRFLHQKNITHGVSGNLTSDYIVLTNRGHLIACQVMPMNR